MQTYPRAPVELVRGEGARLWDSDGKEYLDFLAGISVCIGRALPSRGGRGGSRAGRRLTHMSNLYLTEGGVRLAQRLCESSLGGKAFLCNSGTEANECAIKLVRKHAHGRGIPEPEIVVLEGAFHGRTMGSLSATPRARDATRASRPTCPASARAPRRPRCAPRRRSASGRPRSCSSRSRGRPAVHVIGDEVIAAAREACDEVGRAAGLRRDPDRHGPDRLALGLRAAAR